MSDRAFLIHPLHSRSTVFNEEGTAISLLEKKHKSGTLVIFRLLLREKKYIYIFYSSDQELTVKKPQI